MLAIKLWTSNKDTVDYISSKYGIDALRAVRKYKNIALKLTRCELDLIFLKTCKVYDVFPKFLRFKLYKKSLNSASFYSKWQNKLMRYEIKCKENNTKKLSAQEKESQAHIKSIVSPFDFLIIERFIKNGNIKSRESISKTHEKKLHNLGIARNFHPMDPNQVIFNFSKISIPPRVKSLLAYGLDFCLPVFKIDFVQYFFAFEKLAYKLNFNNPIGSSNDFYTKLKFLSQKSFYGFQPGKVFFHFQEN